MWPNATNQRALSVNDIIRILGNMYKADTMAGVVKEPFEGIYPLILLNFHETTTGYIIFTC